MCTNPLLGIRCIDYDTGAVTVKVLGSAKWKDPSKINLTGSVGDFVKFPCGQCMECRIQKARDWSVRLLHESYLHDESCFLTLTYNEGSLPDDGTLVVEHVQKFLKKYRSYLWRNYKKKIRFYCVGEYGSNTGRPHYHLLIFGDDFSESRIKYKTGKSGAVYFRSPVLESLWDYGFSVIGAVTYDSVFYCAGYVTKKITGNLSKFVYNGVLPEFSTMSRRPGIGHDFVEKFEGDIYNFDSIILKNFEMRPPAYYDKIYAELHPVEFCDLKEKRRENGFISNKRMVEREGLYKDNGCFNSVAHDRLLKNREELKKNFVKNKGRFKKL